MKEIVVETEKKKIDNDKPTESQQGWNKRSLYQSDPKNKKGALQV